MSSFEDMPFMIYTGSFLTIYLYIMYFLFAFVAIWCVLCGVSAACFMVNPCGFPEDKEQEHEMITYCMPGFDPGEF